MLFFDFGQILQLIPFYIELLKGWKFSWNELFYFVIIDIQISEFVCVWLIEEMHTLDFIFFKVQYL